MLLFLQTSLFYLRWYFLLSLAPFKALSSEYPASPAAVLGPTLISVLFFITALKFSSVLSGTAKTLSMLLIWAACLVLGYCLGFILFYGPGLSTWWRRVKTYRESLACSNPQYLPPKLFERHMRIALTKDPVVALRSLTTKPWPPGATLASQDLRTCLLHHNKEVRISALNILKKIPPAPIS